MEDLFRPFFPDKARQIDFSYLEPLDKEVFTCVPEGFRRESDIVFRGSRYRVPIMPVVLYLLKGGGTIRREVYRHHLLGDRPPELRYWSVGLPNLSASRYVVQGGALAGALGALMRPGRWSRVRQKAECLKAILSAHEDATTSLVAWRGVERYLKLDEAGEQRALGLLRKERYEMDLRANLCGSRRFARQAGKRAGKRADWKACRRCF